MAEAEAADVSRQEFSVAYDGAGRTDDHSIDVQTLAPALMAFGRLLREANVEFNGKKATAKVLVVSDFEHKCFNVNFELVVGLLEQAKSMLGLDVVKTAKDVLEWVGLLKGPAAGAGATAAGGLTYLQYLRWKKGRQVVKENIEQDTTGLVKVSITGDNNSVHVHRNVVSLSENPKALRATRDTFLPLGRDGFDTMRVSGRDLSESDELKSDEVEDIAASCALGIEESKVTEEPDVETTPAWLSVYSPVYDLKADQWRFRLGRETIYADISKTTIAQDALARGGALSEDAYQVILEVTTPYDAQGNPKSPSYKIVVVTRFVAAKPTSQPDLFKPNTT